MTARRTSVRNTVGTKPPERQAQRLERKAEEMERPAEIVDGWMGVIDAWIRSSPLRFGAWWKRWIDYTAPTTLALSSVLTWWVGWSAPLIIGFPFVGWWLFWVAAQALAVTYMAAAVAAGWRIWHRPGTLHTKAAKQRMHRRDGHVVRDMFRPRPATVDIQKHDHKRVDILKIPPGTSVDQYQKQRSVAEAVLGYPVTIKPARAGLVAVTQHYKDLLAPVVPRFLPPGADNPNVLWRGIDRDGRPFYSTLSRDGSGYAHLIIGVPDAGKSVLLNNDLAQLAAHKDLVRLWIVDPADGADLGVWHRFAYRLAEDPDAGIDLFGELLLHMIAKRQGIVKAGFQKIPTCPDYPLDVLVLDELPLFTINEDRKQQLLAIKRLTTLRRVGRKANLSIVAATQDIDRNVVPRTMSKLFSHRICLKVSNYVDADMAIPNARKAGYDASAFDPAHHGRAISFDGAEYVEFRSPAFYGKDLRAAVDMLSVTRAEPALFVPADWSQPVDLHTLPAPVREEMTEEGDVEVRDAVWLQMQLQEAAAKAGHAGVNLAHEARRLDVPRHRVERAAKALRMVRVRHGWWAERSAA